MKTPFIGIVSGEGMKPARTEPLQTGNRPGYSRFGGAVIAASERVSPASEATGEEPARVPVDFTLLREERIGPAVRRQGILGASCASCWGTSCTS